MKTFLTSKKSVGMSILLITTNAVAVVATSVDQRGRVTSIPTQERAPVLISTASVQISSISDGDTQSTRKIMSKGVEHISRQLDVHLKNNSSKTIKAYEVCAGGGCKGDWELYDERTVPPGAQFDASPNYQTEADNPQKFTGLISVTAVIFDDGTWEGDEAKVDHIRGQSDGARSFYSEAALIVARAAAVGTRQALEAAEQEIKAIDVSSTAAKTLTSYDSAVALRRGVAKEFVLEYFTHIKERLTSGKVTEADTKSSLEKTAQMYAQVARRQ